MTHKPIDSDTLVRLLDTPAFTPTQKPNSVDGPLKYFDQEMRCGLRGCTSPTHFKVEGIPRCSIHALNELNDMVAQERDAD
jgi:hypothetical protein